MPTVSIITPAYNRADTIVRAIKSAQAQTFKDWEMIIVDDGSTDNTAALVEGMDSRVSLIRQSNAGMTEARNTAIRAASGKYFAFLDSDDEFLPYHLELCVAFLEAHPAQLFVSGENWEDFGPAGRVNHFRTEFSTWYPQKAAIVGARRFDLPPGETDDYLRAYETREPIGEWGRAIVDRVNPNGKTFLYSGDTGENWRYDYNLSITASLIRASAFESLGLPEAQWATGSDFHWLARLCKAARTNFINIGVNVKHEYAADGKLPECGHIVTGKSAMKFVADWNRTWDDLFWTPLNTDPEVRGLRALRLIWAAETALHVGQRSYALECLEQARRALPHYLKAQALYWLVRCTPSAGVARRAFRALFRVMKARLA